MGKARFGGGGRGPDGGGCLANRVALESPGLPPGMLLLLLVRGGNIGRCGSIADMGSGMALVPSPRTGREVVSGSSLVSKERCCKDNGGGGDLSAIPVGIWTDGILGWNPFVGCLGGDCIFIIGMSPVVGL